MCLNLYYRPHKCPDPCTKNSSSQNITVRLTRRVLGMDSRKLDRRYIYSRFCPVKTFRPTEVGGIFTCCTFSVNFIIIIVVGLIFNYFLIYTICFIVLYVFFSFVNTALHAISHFGHPFGRHQNVQCPYRNGRSDLSVS